MTREPLARRLTRVQIELDAIRGVAEVDGVRVVVAPDGRLAGVELAERTLGRGPIRLAELVVDAHRRAWDLARGEADALLAELVDDPTVARALDLGPEVTGPRPDGPDEPASTSYLQDPLAPSALARDAQRPTR